MDRNDKTRVLLRPEQRERTESATFPMPETRGLAGWVLNLLRGRHSQREGQRKQLRLLETLPLGGKRQLMLVSCAGEKFLVGGGLESVETIVRLKAEVSLGVTAKSLDGSCQ
jgi:Flagellar biosynthesis protein, FliO